MTKIVIEVIEENVSDEQARELTRMLHEEAQRPGEFLELTDSLNLRALLVRIVGIVEEKFEPLVPYIAPPLGEK